MGRRFLLATSLLVLPLAALLLAQWPLRDWVQAGSRTANDAAQVVFALYMAVAVSAATRAGAHLCAGHPPAGAPPRWRSLAVFACTAPWAAFLLWSTAPGLWQSAQQQERFSETLTPGYFLIKLAVWLLALLVLLEGVHQVLRAPDRR